MNRLKAAAALVSLLLATAVASAAPVTYVFEGIASGVLAGSAFSNQSLKISLVADTDDISSFVPGGYVVSPTRTRIEIGAGPAYAFADGTYVFALQDPNMGLVGFGTDTLGDLIDLEVGGLPSFELLPAFGPATGSPIPAILAQFQDVLLGSNDRLTVTGLTAASFAAVVGAVPEPASLSLALVAAMLAVAGSRLRRRHEVVPVACAPAGCACR